MPVDENEKMHPWTRKPVHREVALALVRTDGGTQQRAAALNPETVEEMAQVVTDAQEGSDEDALIDHPFDWIKLYEDAEGNLWLADGFYRCAAYERANIPVIGAEIRSGELRDAILHSCHANAKHGTKRTSEDKRKAVMTMLTDDEWRSMSNEIIAAICMVSDWLVANARKELEAENPEMAATTRTGKDGRQYDAEKLGVAGKKGAEKTNAAKTAKADVSSPKDSEPAATEVNPDDEMTDDEWLATLPIYALLQASQESPVVFEGCALSWRTLNQNNFFDQMRYHLRAFGKDQEDELLTRYKDLLRVPHPKDWGLCAHCAGSMEIRVDENNRYVDRGSSRYAEGRAVACNCEGGFVFEGGIH